MPFCRWKLRTATMVSLPARPSVPRGIEATCGQPALNFLHLGQRRGAFASRELLREFAAAHDAVAQMD